jgi:hypothetical protein
MKRFIIVLILALSFIVVDYASREALSMDFKGIEYLTGFGQAELEEKQDYRVIPLMVDFDFDIKPLAEKMGFNFSSMVQFQIEPFLSLVTSPDTNMEVGTSFLLKFGLVPKSWKLQPYIKGGVGMIWMSQHTLDQTTQFNFISSFGAGVHYFFKIDRALTLEYRFRHASNAGIKHPNSGIDNHFCLVGITHLF